MRRADIARESEGERKSKNTRRIERIEQREGVTKVVKFGGYSSFCIVSDILACA